MRRAFAFVGIALLGATRCGAGGPDASPGRPAAEALFPPLPAEVVAAHLAALAAPQEQERPRRSQRPGGLDPYDDLADRARHPAEVLAELAKHAPASVETELLRFARTDPHFVVRCRATSVLARRGHPDARPLVAALLASTDGTERYATWRMTRRVGDDTNLRCVAWGEALDRLAGERDRRVRDALRADLASAREPTSEDVNRAHALVDATSPDVRAEAWILLRCAIREGHGPAVPVSAALDRLAGGRSSPDERASLFGYVGAAGDLSCVDRLVALLERATAHDAPAVLAALVRLGDPGIEDRVFAWSPRLDAGPRVRLLAMLRTPRALEALIAALDDDEALDALVETRDPSASPAISAHLAALSSRGTRGNGVDAPAELASVERRDRLALARLAVPDPIPALLDLVEDRALDPVLRRDAMNLVGDDRKGSAALVRRILAIYREETDADVLDECLDATWASREPGVTEAMLRHAARWRDHGKSSGNWLLRAINLRLGTGFESLDAAAASRPR